ncbi:MAG: hypothetical protein EOM68_17835 [Spirochaetia bacterium]|nr:hypothetical protein [Spirochaetia bacterium]
MDQEAASKFGRDLGKEACKELREASEAWAGELKNASEAWAGELKNASETWARTACFIAAVAGLNVGLFIWVHRYPS